MPIAMQYGSGDYTANNISVSGGAAPTGPQMAYVSGNTLADGTTTDTFTPVAGCAYVLYSVEYAHSSKTFRGAHIRYITAPQADKFGSEACNVGGIYGSSASGITITANNNSTVSISQTSSTYDVKYVIYEVQFA